MRHSESAGSTHPHSNRPFRSFELTRGRGNHLVLGTRSVMRILSRCPLLARPLTRPPPTTFSRALHAARPHARDDRATCRAATFRTVGRSCGASRSAPRWSRRVPLLSSLHDTTAREQHGARVVGGSLRDGAATTPHDRDWSLKAPPRFRAIRGGSLQRACAHSTRVLSPPPARCLRCRRRRRAGLGRSALRRCRFVSSSSLSSLSRRPPRVRGRTGARGRAARPAPLPMVRARAARLPAARGAAEHDPHRGASGRRPRPRPRRLARAEEESLARAVVLDEEDSCAAGARARATPPERD